MYQRRPPCRPGNRQVKRMTDFTRRANLRVVYQSTDISADLQPFLLSWSYTEGLEQADDLQITVEDADGRWMNAWMPERGDRIRADILLSDGDGPRRLPCGLFSVDGHEHQGPPDTMTIKAVSADVNSNGRREKRSKAWSKVSLRQVAEKIAAGARLRLNWQAGINSVYQKLSQSNQSDMEFLLKLCAREGLRVKVGDGQITVFPQKKFDAAAGVLTIRKGTDAVLSHSFKRDSVDTYRAAVIRYRDEKRKKVLEYTYNRPGAPADGQTLRITERCESLAEARRIAPARLMAANRGLMTADITMVGDERLLSGLNVKVAGWGRYDGKYAVEETAHAGPAYTTALKLRQVT